MNKTAANILAFVIVVGGFLAWIVGTIVLFAMAVMADTEQAATLWGAAGIVLGAVGGCIVSDAMQS